MILSAGRGYVFIHIPKTGGTSLALALEARAMKDDIMLGDTPKARRRRRRVADAKTRGRLWKHSTLSDIEGLVPENILDSLFAFTMVRNPWDRAVSYYRWARQQTFSHPSVLLSKSLGFKDFVAHPQIRSAFRASPASSYMRRLDGREHCDLFIRIEHFAEDAKPLFRHLNFRFDLPHENSSDRDADFRRYYDERTARLIAEDCAEDVERFGYEFP